MTLRGLVALSVAVLGMGMCGCTEKGEPHAGPGGVAKAGTTRPEPSRTVGRRVVPRVPKGVRAGYMVFDRETGKVTAQHNAHGTVRSASVVKILIALDHLERSGGRAVPAGDLALLRGMLRSSDDGAATALWNRGGRGAIVTRMVRRLRLADTAPPPASRPGYWGYTAISAYDVVKTYRYLLEKAPERTRRFVLGELRRATRCGKDGFDQYFGIPRALPRPWAVKQGWSGFGTVPDEPCGGATANGLRLRPMAGAEPGAMAAPEPGLRPEPVSAAGPGAVAAPGAAAAPDLGLGRPVLHTTGTVGEGDRRIVVVLTLHPAGGSFRMAATRLTELTGQVFRAGGG
ncbi:D-alanyl-D-alanine carboxypeptidase family protein [Thermomonospora echinospora]|uniref:hypothetical protein n=1 Tax=Thermomonospora echinospora TaxID=1992 RepID=UPI001F24C75D|nr:hypothetical protein [Thermomonospora echinospora]